MSRFVQLHVLTSYPPSNLNRDDTGRPKTALMGDALRLRISSQSQKRAWRTSDVFASALSGYIGTRTKDMGKEIYQSLKDAGVAEKNAREWARAIAGQFGKSKSDSKTDKNEDLQIEQLAHFSTEERAAIADLVKKLAERGSAPTADELALLRKPSRSVDIAMFGRMLADSPAFNVEAAVQVAHAITVHKSAVEDDYFSAVDDLNSGLEDKGAAHIGERSFGAGLFYLYVCINRELLKENLGGDEALTEKALAALIHAVTKVSPTGMQNSHASRAYASYVLAEKGDQQPRSLAQAFLKPVKPHADEDILEKAVVALRKRQQNFDKVYGECADARYEINVEDGTGSLSELVSFVQG
ncbi:type I-E CRISPR-associated protein Cas7/Cse4/CasC [Rhodocyclus purpureus]|uniref:type I-E CRISPR-associated protein Cas7/Cse4/CasC n=1 Tax=Rhodocyclus purpureus TaxID=1067 RepID=UPI001913A52C|nr:type I-E CRISPR-associated protein Cas7/Cse4/CasC [Rhodocyclus purpureus]MBK5913909.1 type I-E CRISPR-associated protein Cas7/Cse4/CasC [Rhodocyclus purpureus]